MLRDYLWTVALMLPFARFGASGVARPAGFRPQHPVALPPPFHAIDAEPAPIALVARTEPSVPTPTRSTAPRRAVNPHEAVMLFCGWLRDHEFVGWHPADDIVGFYQWFCADEGLEEMNHDLIRERFASAPGVTRERRRLNGTSDKEMVRIKKRLGGADRAMLYRVASHEELAEEAKSGKRRPRSSRAGKKAGNHPKTAVKTVSANPAGGTHAAGMTRRAA